MRVLTIAATVLLCSAAAADDVRVKLAIQLELLRLSQQVAVEVPEQPRKELTYPELRSLAIAGNDWMAVAVNGAKAPDGYVLIYRTPSWEGDSTPRVILCYGAKGELWRHSEVAGRAVQPAAPPFAGPLAALIADVSRKPAGQQGYVVPNGLYIMPRARFTQRISKLLNRQTGRFEDQIVPVPRTETESRWQVSGGMEGLTGWKSDRYAHWPAMPRVWVGNIAVLNSHGIYQQNRGWKREYPIGTFFLDVLSTDRGIFEVRRREKTAERWESTVEYRDHEARPEGYHGLKQACASCHNTTTGPGTGGYAAGLVSGSDTIFSHGFDQLEQ